MFVRLDSRYRKVQAYRSSAFLLDFSLISPSGAGAQSDSASALTRGASDSMDSLFPFICWFTVRIVDYKCGGVPYLAIIQDKTKASGDRLEWSKGICRFLNPVKD